mmetsp:Transcript_66845/g.156659  ORF Transcript_66845/g.156659 Transcript_66845/m.156659 type:complete len:524 (-) Transcript_66845:51-1622(-)
MASTSDGLGRAAASGRSNPKGGKSRGALSETGDSEARGVSRFEKLIDFLITGDFKGLFKSVKHGIRNTGRDMVDRSENFMKWFGQRKKEHEQRGMDHSLPHPYPRIRKFVGTQYFEMFGNFIIFCNTFVVGWQAGLTDDIITQNDKDISAALEHVFTFAFVCELTLSTMCWGWTYLVRKENSLDVFLVFIAVLTTWIFGPLQIEVDLLRKFTALRTVRLVRLARSVRLRPEFKEMWMLIKGLTESGETLVWTYVMMGCVLYFFAIIATALIGKRQPFMEHIYEPGQLTAEELFGDVVKSMFTLFQLMTLDSWTGFARPLIAIESWTAFFFIFFISVAVFVMMNLVTAVIVENAFAENKSEEKELAVRLEREKEEELEDLKNFFLQVDIDGSGSLTKQEFFKATKQRKVRQKLRALDIMPKDIDELWDILDSGMGELKAEEFVHGIRRLRGEARAKDILRLYKEVRQFENAVEQVEGHIKTSKNRLENVKLQLTRCRTDIAAFTRTIVRAKEAVKMAAQTQNMT